MNPKLENIVESARADAARIWDLLAPAVEGKLLAAVVSGRAVTGPYVSGRSALDLALILDGPPGDVLAAVAQAFKPLAKKKLAPPLVLSRQELENSLDVFPVEFLALKQTGTVIAGEFDLDSLTIEKEHLRLQCERELRGLVLHCRMAYLSYGFDEAAMGGLVASGAGRLSAVLSATAYLLGTTPDILGELSSLAAEKRPRLTGARLLELACALEDLVEKIDVH